MDDDRTTLSDDEIIGLTGEEDDAGWATVDMDDQDVDADDADSDGDDSDMDADDA